MKTQSKAQSISSEGLLIGIFLLGMTSVASAATSWVGFLINQNTAYVPFRNSGGAWAVIDRSESKALNGQALEIFFNAKTLGTAKVLGEGKQCFHKFTKAETKNSKNCPGTRAERSDRSDQEPPVRPTGPCRDDIGKEVQCPTTASETVEVLPLPDLVSVNTTVADQTQLAKAFATKKVQFDWGALEHIQSQNRPLLMSNHKLTDPDGWQALPFEKFPKDVQRKVVNEVLKYRKTQKCDSQTFKKQAIVITEKDLEFGRAYHNKKNDSFAVPVKVKDIPDLEDCDGNAFGVSSALVIYTQGQATDLLKSMDWNYRNLELLEAADANNDGVSELYFVDHAYNWDGFSLYDFKTKTLVKAGSSSH